MSTISLLAPKSVCALHPDEEGPDFDPALAPKLANANWPEARLEKAKRNYAMEYVRTALPVAVEFFGAEEASKLFTQAARMVGMQFYDQTAAGLGVELDRSAEGFARRP